MPVSFPRIVTVFPFLHSSRPGTGRQARGKSRGQKRKETPRILGVSEINIEFIAAIQTERGRFELPVPCGTPVFKTGAIGRSAISPGRMLGGAAVCVNIPGLLLVEFLPGWCRLFAAEHS